MESVLTRESSFLTVTFKVTANQPMTSCPCWLCKKTEHLILPEMYYGIFEPFHNIMYDIVFLSQDDISANRWGILGHRTRFPLLMRMFPNMWKQEHITKIFQDGCMSIPCVEMLELFRDRGILPEKKSALKYALWINEMPTLEWLFKHLDLDLNGSKHLVANWIVKTFDDPCECFRLLLSLYSGYKVVPRCYIPWLKNMVNLDNLPHDDYDHHSDSDSETIEEDNAEPWGVKRASFLKILKGSQSCRRNRLKVSGITIALKPLRLPSYVIREILDYLINTKLVSEKQIMERITFWNEGTKMSMNNPLKKVKADTTFA
jgi:hypothetical protein